MQSFIIVATKGRAAVVARLLDMLEQQSAPARKIIVVGTSDSDVEGLATHSLMGKGVLDILLSERAGLTIQRNVGLDYLFAGDPIDVCEPAMVAFFDDDFCPAVDWLEQTIAAFHDKTCVAVTGHVLADGINGAAISDEDAAKYISGALPNTRHWASGDLTRDVTSLYGCNMAFRLTAMRTLRFDEALPLYGWLEDRDMSGQARAHGRTIYSPMPRGVHLGVKSARISGLKFGYSQIANPIYLWRKGTVRGWVMAGFVSKALVANVVRSLTRDARADYPGRLKGNAAAISDLLSARCSPERVAQLG